LVSTCLLYTGVLTVKKWLVLPESAMPWEEERGGDEKAGGPVVVDSECFF